MPPFDRAEVKNGFKNDNERTLRNHKGRDTLDYKGNYCYEFDQLLFDGMAHMLGLLSTVKKCEQFLLNLTYLC